MNANRLQVYQMMLILSFSICVQQIAKGYFAKFKDQICIIRFYKRQYFMGNYWTLYPDGTWKSYRKSYFKTPYRNFVIKSIRMYGSSYCRWQVCPVRTKFNIHHSSRKICKVIEAAHDRSLESLRKWGWMNYILGYVYRLPNQHSWSDISKDKRAIFESPNNEDNICENSSNDAWNGHLVPHPFKSERFYICQFIGKGINKSTWEKLQWIAHLMECPEKTYFSIASKTCAWVLDNKR